MIERDAAATMGPEHDAFAELLAGYVDDELSREDRALVEHHLADCPVCRRGRDAQSLIRARLMRETASPVSATLGVRVLERIAQYEAQRTLRGVARNSGGRLLDWFVTLTGWLVAATIAAFWIGSRMGESKSPAAGSGGTGQSGPASGVIIDSHPAPISSAVMTQFESVDQSDLPGELDLAELSNAVPFDVNALRSPHMRFLAAWTTQLYGEPVAAIAYRCHDKLVVQYVVSEKQLFRHPEVRQAIARQGIYAVTSGGVSTVAWAELDSGSFLVGDFSPSELVAMRL